MAEYWKPTIQMFSNVIKRPKMEDKNLQRPPFKFILVVYQETSKATNFGEHLFTEDELAGVSFFL